jgi:hypothetical protein
MYLMVKYARRWRRRQRTPRVFSEVSVTGVHWIKSRAK